MCMLSHVRLFGTPMDYSPPNSSVHWIFQARILEWVSISYSRGSSRPRDWTWVSCIADRFFIIESWVGSNFWVRIKAVSTVLPWWAFGKESACSTGDPGLIPGSGRSSGEENGNPLQILAWRIPWTEEPGGLQSTGSQRAGQDWETNTFTFYK